MVEAIDGAFKNGVHISGIRYRLARWVYTQANCELNHNKVNIQAVLGHEYNTLHEIIDELKKKSFDKCFNEKFTAHPKYSQLLSSTNIGNTLSAIANEVSKGDFSSLTQAHKDFLKSLHLLNTSNEPDYSDSVLAQSILNIITSKGSKVTDIKAELESSLASPPNGIEPEIVHFILVYLTTMGKISLRLIGGDTINISNIADKFRSLAQFEMIRYASKQEELPYEFAERLLNKFGLNGAKMRQESLRNESFKEYKEKMAILIKLNTDISQKIKLFESKPKLYLNIDQLKDAFSKTAVIDWNILDIANHASFNSLEHLNNQLPEIGKAYGEIENLSSTIQHYLEVVADGIDYMEQALEIVNKSLKYAPDEKVAEKFQALYEDTLAIVRDFPKFNNLADRNPVKGKITSFREIYIKEFYYPAHEKYVGKKQDWKTLSEIKNHEHYDEIMLLAELNCLLVAKIKNKLLYWQSLLTWKCTDLDASKLNQTPFCAHCNFLKVEGREYDGIKPEISGVDKTMQSILMEYRENAVAEIRESKANIVMISIPAAHKELINTIIESGALPGKLDKAAIASINELFKHFKQVKLSRDDVINAFFSHSQLLTISQLRQAYFNWENKIKGSDNEDEIRIGLSE